MTDRRDSDQPRCEPEAAVVQPFRVLPDAMLRAVLDALPQAALLVDEQDVVLWANPAAAAACEVDDPAGRAVIGCFPERAHGPLLQLLQRCRAGASAIELRADLHATRRWLANARPVRGGGQDRATLLVLTALEDSPVAALVPQQPGAAFRRLADDAPVMVWVTDIDGRCQWCNAQWLRFRGTDLEQEVDRGWLDGVHVEDLGLVQGAFQRALQRQEPFRLEYRMVRHDGAVRWLLDHGVPRYDGQSRYVGFVGSCVDVTERRKLEEERRHAHKLEAVGRVVSTIAHDFNNLLTVVLGQAEMIQMEAAEVDPGLQQRLVEPTEDLLAACERARVLARRLLSFGGRRPHRVERVSVACWARRFGGILRRLVRESVELRIRVGEHLPAIRIDPSQLEQILLNLTVNAVDAMPDGGRLDIEFVSRADADGRPGLALVVADDGVGISPELQQRIFEPFFTTKPEGRGVGIGLASVREIVDQAGGQVGVESRVGTGSRFTVWFSADVDEADSRTARLPQAAEVRARRPLLVLLCEDEVAVRQVLETTLAAAGHRVVVASRPAQLLERLERMLGDGQRPDALVTDMVMPDMDGEELARRVQEHVGPLPVVFISGYDDLVDGAAPESGARLVGADCGTTRCSLLKPFGRRELLDALDRCTGCASGRSG